MSRVIYVNGRYLPYADAGVHAEDRGNQFGDAVYEVCEVRSGHIVDEALHLSRLERSLAELSIAAPMERAAFGRVLRETIRRNRVVDGLVYCQISRGAGRRNFLFPGPDAAPTVVVLARSQPRSRNEAQAEQGIAVVTAPDMRWGRVDIKTVMLLPSALAKEAAKAKGAKEAWLVDADGNVTEGASSNAWIVDGAGTLVTRPADRHILRGITREVVLGLARELGLAVAERSFSVAEAKAAREAFITSATNTVMPVVSIDGTAIANGHPGSVTRRLRAAFQARALRPAEA